jgi:multiple sugar transport system permease protein
MAGSVLATLPVLMVFLMFQRYFIRGIALSGMKG